MKHKIFLFLPLIFLPLVSFAQVEENLQWRRSVEMYMGIVGDIPIPNEYSISFNKVGTLWASDDMNTANFYINTDADIANSIYPEVFEELEWTWWTGWDASYSRNSGAIPLYGYHESPVFGYGLYKISTNISNSAYFYIDYRDNRIPYSSLPWIGGDSFDLWVKYNYDNNTFYYTADPGTNPPGNFTQISNGQYLKIWEIKLQNPGTPLTSAYPNFWENCLSIIPSQHNPPHPRLIWGPYPSTSLTINNYKVYCKNGPNWTVIATLSGSSYEYTDYANTLTQPNQQAGVDIKYRITAIYNTSSETAPTNEVTVNVPGDASDKANTIAGELLHKNYFLTQNYPNPFNPSTNITIQVPDYSLISLKVYDILGQERVVLVNEYKSSGIYNINFSASEYKLSSGVYFYKLNYRGNSIVKKMILSK